MVERWRDLFGAVGESFLDLMSAELGELEADLGRSGRLAVRVLAASALAAVFVFYATAGLGVVAIVLLDRVWPLWVATLAVTLALLLLAAIAGALAYAWMRRLESPLATVRRRMDSHVRWWQEEILAEELEGSGAPGGEGVASGGGAATEEPE